MALLDEELWGIDVKCVLSSPLSRLHASLLL
jgi:hypothetical protein